jgi:hypothetical protein
VKRILIAFLLLFPVAAAAQSYCGLRQDNVTNALGQAIPNIAVTYYSQPSLAPATVFSSTTCGTSTANNVTCNGATCSNPQTTNGLGAAYAYLAPGLYTVTYSGAQIQTQTYVDQNIPASGSSSAGSIIPSPQFQVPYFSSPGTASALTGSTGVTTNGLGTLTATQLNAAQYDMNCGGSIGLGPMLSNGSGVLDINNPCGVGMSFFPSGTLDPGAGVMMSTSDDNGDLGQPFLQVHHFSYASTLKNLTGIQLKPSFSNSLSLPSPVGIDAALTSSGASINAMTGIGGGQNYTCSGSTVTITGGTLASGAPPSCTATASSSAISLSCSGANSYTVPPLVTISGCTGGTFANLSGYPSLATDLTETSSLILDPAGNFNFGHVALKNYTGPASAVFNIDSTGNVTDALCTSGQFIKGDGTGCGAGGSGAPTGLLGNPVTLGAGPAFSVQPNIFDATQFSGANTIAKIQACLAAALAAGGGSAGGVCDASGFSTTAGITSSTGFTVGNSGGTSEVLNLPAGGSFQGTMTGGTNSMLTQYQNTTITGPAGSGIANKTQIAVDGGTSANYIYNSVGGASGDYFAVDGLAVYNNGAITASGIGALYQGSADGTTFFHMPIEDRFDTYGAKFDGTCCGTTHAFSQFNSANVAGLTPVWINDGVSTVGKTQGLNFISDTFVHPGAGLPVVKVTDTTGQPLLDTHFFGSYIETNSTDTTSALITNSGAKALGFFGTTIHCNDASRAPFLTSDNSYNTQITVFDLEYGTGGVGCGTSGFSAIVNNFTGHTVVTDSNNAVAMYLSGRAWMEDATIWSLRDPTQAASSGQNCLQIDTMGFITNTGSACSSGGGGSVSGGTAGYAAIFGSATTITSGVPLANAVSANQYPCSTGAGTGVWNPCSFPTSALVIGTNSSAVPVAATSANVAGVLWTYANNTSATGGTGTGTVTCLTATCTNLSGSYSVVGGTFTTGTLLTLVWPTTTTAYKCSVSQNGGAAFYGLGHGVATATGMTITNTVTVTGVTVSFDYTCSEY